jgi:hypothetical protein
MSDTALGKRKTSDNATNEGEVPFDLIPDVCWHHVAEFAVSPDGESIPPVMCARVSLFFWHCGAANDLAPT